MLEMWCRNFYGAHLNVCKVPETHCNFCGTKGHFEKCCNSRQKDKLKKIAIPRNFDTKSHKNADRVQSADYYEDQDTNTDELVLNVEGKRTKKITHAVLHGTVNYWIPFQNDDIYGLTCHYLCSR